MTIIAADRRRKLSTMAAVLIVTAGARIDASGGLGETLAAAEAMLRQAQVTAAIEQLRALEPRHGEDPAFLALLGRALAQNREFAAAEPLLTSATEGGYSDLRTLLTLGDVLWENGRLDEAEARYRAAVADSGSDPAALRSLAKLLLWRGEAQGAVRLFAQVLKLRPGWPAVSLNYARALEQVGDLEAALRAIELFVVRSPEHADALYTQATILSRLGRRSEAAEALARFQRAAEEDRARALVLGRREAALSAVVASLGSGDLESAHEQLDRLPETVDTLRLRARAFELSGRVREAVRLLERAVGADPSRADVRLELQEAYRRLGPSG